ILVSIDTDGAGPAFFSLPVVAATSETDGEFVVASQRAHVPMGARLAWDNSNGPHRGRLYATFVDMANDLANGPDETTLSVTYMDPDSTTWSDARRVSREPNFQSMFLPSIAVDSVTGDVAVGWYGTRGTLGQTAKLADYYVATSRDGVTFSPAQQIS